MSTKTDAVHNEGTMKVATSGNGNLICHGGEQGLVTAAELEEAEDRM